MQISGHRGILTVASVAGTDSARTVRYVLAAGRACGETLNPAVSNTDSGTQNRVKKLIKKLIGLPGRAWQHVDDHAASPACGQDHCLGPGAYLVGIDYFDLAN